MHVQSHDIYFDQQKKKRSCVAFKRELGEQICSNSMLSLDVTQPLTSMVLVKVLHLRIQASSLFCEQAKVFNSQSASMKEFVLLERRYW